MFWKFHVGSSGLDTLLAKEDVTLQEVLDEEDVLQECKTQNAKLIEFLSKDEILSDLVDLAITEPPENEDETSVYKYTNLACEVITSDMDAVVEKMGCDQELLDKIWGFLDKPPPLNPLLASFFSKIITMLLSKKSQNVLDYMKSHNVIDKLLIHLEVSAIMEIFIKMVTVVDTQVVRFEIAQWLNEQEVIKKLTGSLDPNNSPELHYNTAQLLSELVRIGRESMSQNSTEDDLDPLLTAIESEENLSLLLDKILSINDTNSESALVNGLSVLLSLIEIRKPSIDGLEELVTPLNTERIAQSTFKTLQAVTPRLKDFHNVLLEPPCLASMTTTAGVLDPPLGKVRLNIAWLISAAVATNTQCVNNELTQLGTVNVLLDLFFKFQWNNFLHTQVEHCLGSVLSSEPITEDGELRNPLLTHVIVDCCLVTKIIKALEENESQQSQTGGQRRGYMGHLTKVANNFISNKEKGNNSVILNSLFNDLPEGEQKQWDGLVVGYLKEINMKNTVELQISSHPLHSSSEEDEGESFRPVSVFQYEHQLQQAFSNYQVQQMTNEFIDSFGYDEEEIRKDEKTSNPFDEVGKINFNIDANEETPDATLFEAVCNEKLHQFDDNNSDEEDIWEEKELKYLSPEDSRQRKVDKNSDDSGSDSENDGSHSSTDEDDEKIEFSNEVKTSEPKQPTNNTLISSNMKDHVEKMDIDTTDEDADWAANFDSEGVAMDTLDAAAVGWVDPGATSIATTSSDFDADFADFTNISKFENSADHRRPESPVAMDEEQLADSTKPETIEIHMEDDTVYENKDKAKQNLATDNMEEIKNRTEEKKEPEQEKQGEEHKSESTEVNQDPEEQKENRNSKQNVKIDLVQTEHDPLLVTSQVMGGFVVIDAPPTSSKGHESLSPSLSSTTNESHRKSMSPTAEKPVSPRGGVSVVTISSRQVISINEENKEDTIVKISSPRSPGSGQSHSKSQSKSLVKLLSPERWVEDEDLKLNLTINGAVHHSQEETVEIQKNTDLESVEAGSS